MLFKQRCRSAITTVCFLAVFVAAMPQAAFARSANVTFRFHNGSDACAWVTAYWSYKSEAHWRIVGGGSRPRWVAPRSNATFSENFNHSTLGPQMRIRTQVMSTANGACTGRNGRPDVTTQVNLSIEPKNAIDRPRAARCDPQASLNGNRSSGYKLESWGQRCF
jgi:hypothetical protein